MALEKQKKSVLMAWCLYDWASAGFPVIVTTFIFATYFTTEIAINEIKGTAEWANAIALAGIIIALISPVFGAIADRRGNHKTWLGFFTFVCVISSALLWYAYPDSKSVYFILGCVIVGTVSLEVAQVFYNSFLPHIAPRQYIGRISGWAWGLGYFSGMIVLIIALYGFVKSPPAWLNTASAEPIRICGPLVALWLALFSLPLFIMVPNTPSNNVTLLRSIRLGLGELLTTLRTLPREKNLMLYLIAHLIYIDGLNTLFAFAGIYAAGTFHMKLPEVILFGLTMNISAGIGATLFAWGDDYFGSKSTILMALFCLVLFGSAVLWIEDVRWFWACGLLLTLFVGPVQAASRSLMARLTTPEKSSEWFGLFASSGKITSFIGPWLVGYVTLLFGSQRAGMATVILFFLAGGIFMCFIREPKKNVSIV